MITLEFKIQTSETFRKWIELYPESGITIQYKKYGDMYLNSAGHFATALWKGNIEEALSRADLQNRDMLRRILGVMTR